MMPRAPPPAEAARDSLQVGLCGVAAHAEQPLGLFIKGKQLVVRDRPLAALVGLVRAEFVARIAQQRRAVPLGLAAEVEIFLGAEVPAAIVPPEFAALEFANLYDALEVERGSVRGNAPPFSTSATFRPQRVSW